MALQTAGAAAQEPWFPIPVSHGATQWAQIVTKHTGLQPTEEPRARGSAPFVASGKQTNPLS